MLDLLIPPRRPRPALARELANELGMAGAAFALVAAAAYFAAMSVLAESMAAALSLLGGPSR